MGMLHINVHKCSTWDFRKTDCNCEGVSIQKTNEIIMVYEMMVRTSKSESLKCFLFLSIISKLLFHLWYM